MVLALYRTLHFIVLLAAVPAIWNYPDDDYKFPFRENHTLNDTSTRKFQTHGTAKHNGNRHFTQWSDWDQCDHYTCSQNRSRLCLKRNICGDNVQTETRSCRIDDCDTRDEHITGEIFIRNTTDEHINLINYNITHRHRHSSHRKRFIHIARLPKLTSMLRSSPPGRSTRGFSKWSRWTPCSRQCITIRRRKCIRRRLCGKRIIKESAYCYVENSNCHEWVRKKIQESKTNFIFETISSSNMATSNHAQIDRSNAISGGSRDAQCGILYGNKSSRMRSNLWSMMRIIGGRPSSKGKWVWQVVILNRFKEAFCGGSLVSLRWVLTAAHCVRKRLYVRIGEYSLSMKDDYEEEMQIREAVIHPLYNPETVDNDVALLRLPQAARPDRGHGTVCLPHYHQPLPSGRLCTIIGWGKRRSTDYFGADTLQEAEVPIIPMETCRRTYVDYYITNNMFCAGYRRGRMDSCAGDSGGPLLCKDPTKSGEPWTIYGITSFGDGCGKRGKYGIYTRLPNYVNWINKVLKITYFRD